jgi:hypothetical protein
MRVATLALAGAFGLALAATGAAAPLAPAPLTAGNQNVIDVAGGCWRGYHPNRWGHCVPNRRWHRYGYRWQRHTPSDFVANQLNRQELMRSGGGFGYYGGPGWGY